MHDALVIVFHRIVPAKRKDTTPPQDVGEADGDVAYVLLVFWAVSVVRVAVGLAQHEIFAAEGSLAFLAVIFVPWLIDGGPLRWLRRSRVAARRSSLRVLPHDRKR